MCFPCVLSIPGLISTVTTQVNIPLLTHMNHFKQVGRITILIGGGIVLFHLSNPCGVYIYDVLANPAWLSCAQ